MTCSSSRFPRARAGCRLARSGLTLVELMLALAVVALLAAIGVRAWDGWRDRVRVQRAQGDIIAMSLVIDGYFADRSEFPPDLTAIGRALLKDPWGRPYVYRDLTPAAARGHARKDHSLVPLNSDYDLYSKGPDGASSPPLTARSSRDDIVRANNGQFIGRASDY